MIQGQLLSSVYMTLGGRQDLWMDGGLPPSFQKVLKLDFVSTLMMNFGWKLPIVEYSRCLFQPNQPMFEENVPKMTLVREFWPKTHQYRQHIPVPSTCYVPPPLPQEHDPRLSWPLAFTSKNSTNIQPTSMGQPYPHDGLPALRELMWAGYWVHVNAWRDFAGEGPTICTCREGPKFVDIYVIRGAC